MTITRHLAFGGYYAVEQPDGFHVFRLLDLSATAMHAQAFAEIFEGGPPTFEEVSGLTPSIMHLPLTAQNILSWDGSRKISLVGHKPLVEADLDGCKTYMEELDMPADKIAEVMKGIIDFSHETPMTARVTAAEDGDIIIDEPPADI